MTPFFTIITVCLNAGEELEKTIISILKQKFQNFNIIIKDGLSNDDSFAKLPSSDKIIKVQKKDSGIYDAMNQALEYANGEYILFLNAGDLFYDDSVLGSFFDTITNNKFPALAYCDYTTTALGEYVQSPQKLTNFFLFRTMLCHQVCMIKRDYYNNIGHFNTNLRVDADYDFLLRLLIVNKGSYQHFQKLGIISSSYGFSYQNRDIAIKEVKEIRKRYFPNSYFMYIFLLALTFPSMRQRIANKNGIISKLYQRIVNVYNQLS